MKSLQLDATDIRILSAIQQHGRMSKSELATLVNLSPTPCWMRLNKLKEAGFIRSYRAEIALARITDFTQVIVTIALTQHRKADFDRFEAHIFTLDAIIECVATSGGMDYILKVISKNLIEFQTLMESLLTEELGIKRYMAYIVTKEIKSTLPNIAQLAKP